MSKSSEVAEQALATHTNGSLNKHAPAPGLDFGRAWEYAPAPETVKVKIEETYGLFIDGKFVPPKGGKGPKHFATTNPATEQVLSHVSHAGEADVDAAVRAARKAFPKW